MKYILSLLLFMGTFAMTAKEKADIVLTKDNTVVLNDTVNWDSISKVSMDLLLLSTRVPEDQPIYLFLSTPGGSVLAGSAFIEVLKHIPQEVHTITSFAASMGFSIVQASDKRIILETGTLMSHRASLGGLEGQLDGEIETRIRYYKDITNILNKEAANRMGLSLGKYKRLINREYWAVGNKAVSQGAADKVASVTCSLDLLTSHNIQKVRTLFGAIELKFSNCPLIVSPIEVIEPTEKKKTNKLARDYVNLLFNNKTTFINRYIKTGIFNR